MGGFWPPPKSRFDPARLEEMSTKNPFDGGSAWSFVFSRGGLYGGWLVVSWHWPTAIAVGGVLMICGAIFFGRWLLEQERDA